MSACILLFLSALLTSDFIAYFGLLAQHADCKAELREALAGLQFSNAERERLAIETAEQKDAILVHSTARAKLDESHKETSNALALAKASLAEKTEQVPYPS